jgi:hypothetical protein
MQEKMQPLWKWVWGFSKKPNELQYDLAVPLMNIYLKECKSGYNKDTYTAIIIVALFTIAKLYESD